MLADVTLRAIPWDDAAAQAAARLPFDAPHAWQDWLKREIDSGAAALCAIESPAGERLGILAYRIDQQQKKELRILAAYAPKAQGLTPRIFRAAESLAKKSDCVTVCFSTLRPGLISQAIQDGYHVSEVFLSRPVP